MRALIGSVIAVGLLVAAYPAQANDGCSFDYYGRLHCLPGARPGVPYYGPGYQRGYEYGRGPYRRCPREWTVQDGVCKPYRGY